MRSPGLNVAGLRIFDSERPRAERLATIAGARMPGVMVADSVEQALQGAVGLVNGTPVGHAAEPKHRRCPMALLHDGLWVADAVYNRRSGPRC